MPYDRTAQLSRRGLLAAGGAVGLGAMLAACGESGGSGSSKESAKGGAWSFTDDRQKKASTKSTPKSIVAFTGTAAALHDYGIEVKGVFGPTKAAGGKPDVQAGDLDIAKVEILGNVYGEFNVEKYAALRPEVLITDMWEKDALWYVPEESKDKILKLAPSVALWAADVSMTEALERRAALAESLGADLKARKVVDAKARYEKALGAVREAAKSNPGIKVLIGSGSPDYFYASAPGRPTDTRTFKELGIELVTPGKLDQGGWFESLSWENADKYPADVIMMDNRSSALQPEALAKSKPIWKKLPAVKAGQVIPRVTEPVYSYDKCAPLLEDLAEAIKNAKKVS
ncbi:ABC transporter substrate-binding protein [Streptomyces pathocidini]|uniref:ABC transporter substrate-binding protein n=1 Tax=Streptomyces pathocidini TaxID=1650571 RepID=UPI0033CA0BEA